MKTIISFASCFVLGLALFSGGVVPTAEAATYQYDYQYQYQYQSPWTTQYYYYSPGYQHSNQSQAALRAQLIAQINQLLALIQAQGPIVIPPAIGDNRYDVEVTTRYAEVEDDEAELFGEVDLGSAPSVRVWFEYGENRSNLNERSRSGVINRRDNEFFRADIDDLDEDETYYFRAVAQAPNGFLDYGRIISFETDGDGRFGDDDDDDDDDNLPDVTTDRPGDVDETSAELRGEVDMNDFENGYVFFVYGEDEDQVMDVEDDYDTYNDIDEDGDDLQKFQVDSDLDDSDEYEGFVSGLRRDTDYFYAICVEFEDEDDDDRLLCGDVEEFTTDDDFNDDDDSDDELPDVRTESAENVDEDSAELFGEIDMNDFDDGLAFFVYGQDESQVEDIESDYDTYSDIDEDGDDLQKFSVDSSLDDFASFEGFVSGLEDDSDYFFSLCVEFEDEDNDDRIICGGVEEFTTDRD